MLEQGSRESNAYLYRVKTGPAARSDMLQLCQSNHGTVEKKHEYTQSNKK